MLYFLSSIFTFCFYHFEGNRYGRGGGDRYGPPTRTDYRLIVENLSSRCSWQDLKVQSMRCNENSLGFRFIRNDK